MNKKFLAVLLVGILLGTMLMSNGCAQLPQPAGQEKADVTQTEIPEDKPEATQTPEAEPTTVSEYKPDISSTATIDGKKDLSSCDVALASLGYYFVSVEEAVSYYEGAYAKTSNQRDLVDLCICLTQSDSMKDKKAYYYPIVSQLLEENDRRLNGFGYSAVGTFNADYALLLMEKDVSKCVEILKEYAEKSTKKPVYYDALYSRLLRPEPITQDIKSEYELIKKIYDVYKTDYQVTIVTKQEFCSYLYNSAVELGYVLDALSYKNEEKEFNDYIANHEDEAAEDYSDLTYIDVMDDHGYYFENDYWIWNTAFNQYKQTGNQRCLADACVMLALYFPEDHENVKMSFPELLAILDEQGYVTGIGTADEDLIYSTYAWAYVNDETFNEAFDTYIEKAHSKTFFVKEMLTQMLVETQPPDFEDIAFVFNEGVKLIENIDPNPEKLSEQEYNDYSDLMDVMNWAYGQYPELAEFEPPAGNAMAA